MKRNSFYKSLPGPGVVVGLVLTMAIAGCGGSGDRSDAYGNFEATEVLVSAEAGGRLIRFDVADGDRLQHGQAVALVDTLQLSLRRAQIDAQRAAVRTRLGGIAAQLDVLEEQRRVAEREQRRVQGLVADGAATTKQLDDIEGQIAVLDRQTEAIRQQNAPVFAELDVLEAQRALLSDQIRRSRVVNPVAGTVLVTYAEPSEMTAPGKPLYKIARLDTLTLRAYVSGAQLPHIRLGQTVSVLIDETRTTNRALDGTITWIADEAEFTPKPIQTKEERVNLVYAFKVRVPNPDGALKIGMPAEVVFPAESAD